MFSCGGYCLCRNYDLPVQKLIIMIIASLITSALSEVTSDTTADTINGHKIERTQKRVHQ